MAPHTSEVSERCSSALAGLDWIDDERHLQPALLLVLALHKALIFSQGGWVKTFSRMDVAYAEQAREPGRDTKLTS